MSFAGAQSTRVFSRESVDQFVLHRKLLILVSQAALLVFSYYCAFLLRFDFTLDGSVRSFFWKTLGVVLILKLVFFSVFGLLRGWWQYVGMSDLLDISKASIASSAILIAIVQLGTWPSGYPRSVLLLDLALTILFTGGARCAVRAYTDSVQHYAAQKNTLIVGAGAAGSVIVRELQRNPRLDYKPVVFLDDNRAKKGLKIHGVKVLGTTDSLSTMIERHSVACVIIAIPSATGEQIQRIVGKCRECKVDFKILPTLSDRLDRPSLIHQLRSVRVEDLLGRKPVHLDVEAIKEKLHGNVVLVTGAAGSIGSELVRQLAQFAPREVILYDRCENDLFKLGMELAARMPELNFVPVVGDILDVGLLREVFSLHRPHFVFHAAAYKHVPMMERNCFQAISNNVFGTYNVALVSRQYGVEQFVLISSDKAVNPTNIMGTTKRVAELIILGLQKAHTRFCAVRFGNVLGSNGSVLPIFEQQIAKGGPITVTHPDARRFFMTIPEASQLVLQASAMGRGGEIFVLDMGEPMKITDLATNLIRLSGLEPGREIEIAFTGLRPGEKLFEELSFEQEGIKPTAHDKIRVFDGGEVRFDQVQSWLNALSAAVDAKNVHQLIQTLQTMVPEYTPSEEIRALCQVDRHDVCLVYRQQRFDLSVTTDTAREEAA
ncbi:MAG TPA: nucleoside-diphosphate sugar epimerase/dehydratase [Candidatus Angelobacter sp.]|nr:nucleoside-diphosphate sugar epimerase/dehydratase [Candidatus Angelobacter sp.]